MTQDEAIIMASLLLQKLFRDDDDSVAIIKVAEKERDIDNLTSALDQLEKTCIGLKQGLLNKQKVKTWRKRKE